MTLLPVLRIVLTVGLLIAAGLVTVASVLPVAMAEGAIQPYRGDNQSENELCLSAL
jgi:hypothetical protein